MPEASHVSDRTIACIECDLLVAMPELSARQRCRCPRCDHVLSFGNLERARHALPFALCAAMLLPVSLLFPFMSFARAGVNNEMTLIETSWALFSDGSVLLAAIVFTFIIALPACVVTAIVLVATSLNARRRMPLLATATRFIFAVDRWSMVEVFIIGALISLIKIADMATVTMGASLVTYFAFAAFTVAALGRLDRYVVWRHVRHVRNAGISR